MMLLVGFSCGTLEKGAIDARMGLLPSSTRAVLGTATAVNLAVLPGVFPVE